MEIRIKTHDEARTDRVTIEIIGKTPADDPATMGKLDGMADRITEQDAEIARLNQVIENLDYGLTVRTKELTEARSELKKWRPEPGQDSIHTLNHDRQRMMDRLAEIEKIVNRDGILPVLARGWNERTEQDDVVLVTAVGDIRRLFDPERDSTEDGAVE